MIGTDPGTQDSKPRRVRLVHKVVERFHVFTSPDVKGFNVSGDTLAEAQWEAIKVLEYLVERHGWQKPEVSFVEMVDAA